MKQNKTLFLAGYTARSQAYAQTMTVAGIAPDYVLLFGDTDSSAPGFCSIEIPLCNIQNIHLPDLSIPVIETCRKARWKVRTSKAIYINTPEIINIITEIKPDLIIYSGYGGQIVGDTLLNTEIPFLHIHSGWLPDERGSTTIYYSLIKNDKCSASAIILAKAIDKGPILLRRHYPKPPPGIDIDYVYDSAIRADLLIQLLKEYIENGKLPNPLFTNTDEGTTYYVIHPVLKHIAILSCTGD